MRVLVLAPMQTELAPVRKRLGLRADGEVWTGRCGDHHVVAAMAGVGTRRSAAVARGQIAAMRPDHVLVCGVAGALAPDLRVGDVVVPAVAVDLDEGGRSTATAFGDLVPAGEVVTSTHLHGLDVLQAHIDAGVLAVDMETAAIASACDEAEVPWSAIRALSDLVRDETVDGSAMDLLREDGTPDLGAVARLLVRHPSRVRGLVAMGRDAAMATGAAAARLEQALLAEPER